MNDADRIALESLRRHAKGAIAHFQGMVSAIDKLLSTGSPPTMNPERHSGGLTLEARETRNASTNLGSGPRG